MSVFASPRFLRNVLLADAASCLASGAAQLGFNAALARLLNLPSVLLFGTGVFLVVYGTAVAFIATRDPVPNSSTGGRFSRRARAALKPSSAAPEARQEVASASSTLRRKRGEAKTDMAGS